jgi:hypothetical protein
MIPITGGQTLPWTDGKSGITYQWRYVTGENQDAFFALMKDLSEKKVTMMDQVDFFVVGCSGDKAPTWPDDGCIARRLRAGDLLRVSQALNDAMGDLTGFVKEDLPNS